VSDPRPSIGGGIDLSYLKRDRTAATPPTEQPGGATTDLPKVPALVVEADATSLRSYLALSDAVPVLIYFHSDRSAESAQMFSELSRLTLASAGKVLLAKIDADKAPEIAQALGVAGLPSLVAVLKGQPAPLFSAVVALDQLKLVFDKVLQVAAENGLTATLGVDENIKPAPEAPKLSEAMVAGYQAMEASDFAAAQSAFEAELNQNPSNDEPKIALEQVKFLERLSHFEIDSVLKAARSESIDELLQLSDATFAAVSPAAAFDLLLDRFALGEVGNRDAIRTRLISFFALVGGNDKDVASARIRLANLLF
jgi:putative thioredoxin